MTDKPENPPAFPCIDNSGPNGQTVWRYDGMTLRDYFAGKALQGLCAICGMEFMQEISDEGKERADSLAFASNMLADAMLKARGE